MRKVDSGRSSPRALESAPFESSIALEVSVEHGHRTEAESLDGLQSFSSEVERITRITDKDITAKDVSVAVARHLKEMSGMFKRRQVVRSVISEENLLRLNFSEQVDMPRFEEFSFNAASELRPVLLTFEHIKNSSYMLLRTSEYIIIE